MLPAAWRELAHWASAPAAAAEIAALARAGAGDEERHLAGLLRLRGEDPPQGIPPRPTEAQHHRSHHHPDYLPRSLGSSARTPGRIPYKHIGGPSLSRPRRFFVTDAFYVEPAQAASGARGAECRVALPRSRSPRYPRRRAEPPQVLVLIELAEYGQSVAPGHPARPAPRRLSSAVIGPFSTEVIRGVVVELGRS